MNIEAILKAAWFTPGLNGRWGLPLLFEGDPGTAKSKRTEAAAKRLGLPIEVVLGSIREPSDFLGLPIPDGDRVIHAPAAWAMRLKEAGRGVAFFDELNTAAPAVQAALLRVILEGSTGDLVLPPGIRFVAAQNAVEEAAGGYDLAMPLANRFGHIQYEADIQRFFDHMLGATGNDGKAADAEQEEKRVLREFPAAHAKACGTIVGFLQARPELACKKPKAGDPQASKAWPSWRTWDLAGRARAGAEIHGLTPTDTEDLVAAFVGQGAAIEFFKYMEKLDLPNGEDLLDEKVAATFDDRLDRTYAILAGCTALVAPATAAKRKDRAKALWKIFKGTVKDAPDVVVPYATRLVKAGLGDLPEADPVLKECEPIFRATGRF